MVTYLAQKRFVWVLAVLVKVKTLIVSDLVERVYWWVSGEEGWPLGRMSPLVAAVASWWALPLVLVWTAHNRRQLTDRESG